MKIKQVIVNAAVIAGIYCGAADCMWRAPQTAGNLLVWSSALLASLKPPLELPLSFFDARYNHDTDAAGGTPYVRRRPGQAPYILIPVAGNEAPTPRQAAYAATLQQMTAAEGPLGITTVSHPVRVPGEVPRCMGPSDYAWGYGRGC
jgi:hypothetical protein